MRFSMSAALDLVFLDDLHVVDDFFDCHTNIDYIEFADENSLGGG
jgi:hypothetical protein